MAAHPEPALDEHLWTIAAARLLLAGDVHVQAPPNLAYDDFPRLLDAGIDDWGGVSPVTIDHVNPEAPWPELERLAAATRSRGLELAPRLPVYPDVPRSSGSTRRAAGGAARVRLARARARGRWSPGERGRGRRSSSRATRCRSSTRRRARRGRARPAVPRARRRARSACSPPPTGCGARCAATRSRYVVTRNIQYTNVCYFRCGFCAFSKGKLAANLRGAPYLVPLEEIVRRAAEAWERGATEVCLQGGIHPAFTGDYYASVVEAIRAALPGPARPRVLGARDLAGGGDARPPARRRTSRGCARRARLAARDGGRDPRRRGARGHLPRQGDDRAVARGARRGAPRRPALERDDDVRPRRAAASTGRATCCGRASSSARTGGFTEFVPLPFVHMEAPMWLRGRARSGPTFGETLLVHAVARLALHPEITNIQVSWVKLGPEGVAAGAARRRQRPRRHADERVDLARRRLGARAGDAAGADGGADPLGRPRAAPAHDAVRRRAGRAARALFGAAPLAEPFNPPVKEAGAARAAAARPAGTASPAPR